MTTTLTRRRVTTRSLKTAGVFGLLTLAAILVAACGSPTQAAAPAQATTAASPTRLASPTVAAADLKLLKMTPDNGTAGTAFEITGEGLPPNQDVHVSWATVDGSYTLTASAENVQFNSRTFTPKRLDIASGHVGADGKVDIAASAPDDFGEVHDVFLTVAGQDVARGGFRIMRNVSINPTSGPIGTPITITVTGLSWSQYSNTIAVRYDNTPTGIITAVTTRGSSAGVIRAAGTIGKHVIDIDHGARSVPYLNNQQSGTANIPDWRFWFTITDDTTLPPNTLDWPDSSKLGTAGTAAAPLTTSAGGTLNPNASVAPASGPILSNATVTVTGMTPNAAVDLLWVTAHGNRVSPSGWSLSDTPLANGTVAADGTLTASFAVPNDLGGWHVVKVVSNDTVVAEIPYFVEHSLVSVTPEKVKAGDVFTVHLKGIGWTELDNGVAVTYDNAYIGFDCGFNSQGDVTMNLVATGAPGIHLIDIYPMIYQGHGDPPWGYQAPLLAFQVDAPGLALGYNLPAYRLAIEVTN